MHSPLHLKRSSDVYKKVKQKAYKRGLWGERIATFYLQCKGYAILERRFKTPFGEIDLLARKVNVLVAIEVKSRPSLEQAMFSLTPSQQRRIERALTYYLAHFPSPPLLRFDVVLLAPWTWPRHIKAAWRSP